MAVQFGQPNATSAMASTSRRLSFTAPTGLPAGSLTPEPYPTPIMPQFYPSASYPAMPLPNQSIAPYTEMSSYASSPRFMDVLNAYNAGEQTQLAPYSAGPFSTASSSNVGLLPTFPNSYPPAFSPIMPTSFSPSPFGSSSVPSTFPGPSYSPLPAFPRTTNSPSPGLYDFDRPSYQAPNPFGAGSSTSSTRFPGSPFPPWNQYKS